MASGSSSSFSIQTVGRASAKGMTPRICQRCSPRMCAAIPRSRRLARRRLASMGSLAA